MTDSPSPGWLVLIHQIPPKPAYLRAERRKQLEAQTVRLEQRLAEIGVNG